MNQTDATRGRFITFEGIDGAGKSTHIGYVTSLLKGAGKRVVSTREPGGTPLGEKLRDLVLHEKMHLETEALIMFASRREHVAQVVEPAIARGDWVLSDRFTDASFAYQGGGRGLERAKPDLTLLFDVPLDVAKARLSASRTLDKFEMEQADFFARVRGEYLRRAAASNGRIVVIDSTKTIAEVRAALQAALETWL